MSVRLLVEIAPMSAVARSRHVSAVARHLAVTDPGVLDALVLRLSAEPEHHAWATALQLAQVGRRVPALLALLDAPYPDLAARAALSAAAQATGDAEVDALVARVPDLPADVLDALLRGVRRAAVPALADALVPVLRATRGDALAGRVLGACSASVVDTHVGTLWHRTSHRVRFAQRFPATALSVVRGRLETSARPWEDWGPLGARSVTEGLLAVDPARHAVDVLDLVETYGPHDRPDDLWTAGTVSVLAAHEPARTAALLVRLLRTDPSVQRHLTRKNLRRFLAVTDLGDPADVDAVPDTAVPAPALDPAAGPLVDVGRAVRGTPHLLARVLDVAPPSRRGRLWDLVHAGGRTVSAGDSSTLVAALPRGRRTEHARQVLRLAERDGEAGARLAALAGLPLAEVETPLHEATTHADPSLRATAYRSLLASTARERDPATLARVLGSLDRLRNEQEPVRAAALDALADVPAGLFTDAAAPALEGLFRDAVEARDHSPSTAHAIRSLSGRLLVSGPGGARALTSPLARVALAALLHDSGEVELPDLEHVPAAVRDQVVATFSPLVVTQAAEQRYDAVLALVRAFGRHARRSTVLVGTVGSLLLDGAFGTPEAAWLTGPAIDLLLAEPSTRDAQVRRLVAALPAAVVEPQVWTVVSRRLTDLLSSDVLTGRRAGSPASDGPWVPTDVRGAVLWTPAQLADLAGYLSALAADRPDDPSTALRAVDALAGLPDVGPPRVLAAARSTTTVVAEAALAALGAHAAGGHPEAVHDALLQHLGGDRARVAAPAVVQVAHRLPPSVVLRSWSDVLGDGGAPVSVTVRKALVLAVPSVYLPVRAITVLAGETPHRDVRTAAATAALRLLGAPEAWGVVDASLPASPVVGRLLRAVTPGGLAVEDRDRLAGLVAQVCTAPVSDDVGRAARAGAVASAGRWAPYDDGIGRALVAQVTDLDDQTWTWHGAASVLVELVHDGTSGPWTEAVRRLVEAGAAAGTTAPRGASPSGPRDVAEADLRPRAVERLDVLTQAGVPWRTPAHAPALVADAVGVLLAARTPAGVPVHTGRAAVLVAEAVDLDPATAGPVSPAEAAAAALDGLCALVAGRPVVAVRCADVLRGRLSGGWPQPERPWWLAAVDRLLDGSVDPAGQLLLLGVLRGLPTSEAVQAYVRRLSTSDDPDVAEAASAGEVPSLVW